MKQTYAKIIMYAVLAIVIFTIALPASAGAELPYDPIGYAVCTAGPSARVSHTPGGVLFRITGDYLWTQNFILSNEAPGARGIENIYIELVPFRANRTTLGSPLYMRWVDAEGMCSRIYTYRFARW